MELKQLQIELRPRSTSQALDLGFTLLRANAGNVYAAWLALWLPVMGVAMLLSVQFPDAVVVWAIGAWWCKPMLERAPLYVLSRQVFGEPVSWHAALRAWPRQLAGGAIRMLTWGRLFAAGRCLYQPVWMLEMARGKVARQRRRVLRARRTGAAANWFGIACATFDIVLLLGVLAFIGIFLSDERTTIPLFYLIVPNGMLSTAGVGTLVLGAMAVSGGLIGPIYTACGFTLYLNRRASLEAWDIEIVLRQIRAPVAAARRPAQAAAVAVLLGPVLLGLALLTPPPAHADTPACPASPNLPWERTPRAPAHDPAQAALREELERLYDSGDLAGICEQNWYRKKHEVDRPTTAPPTRGMEPDVGLLALALRWLFIGGALAAAGWLLYRYRDQWLPAPARTRAQMATEIGGLDIRAASLPADVAAAVRALWRSGQQRAALALLYRATLSRLVSQDHLALGSGATEGDCLRLAHQGQRDGHLDTDRLAVLVTASTLWLNGAYAGRWPPDDVVEAGCNAWDSAFAAASPMVTA